jgi:hypothetical protein
MVAQGPFVKSAKFGFLCIRGLSFRTMLLIRLPITRLSGTDASYKTRLALGGPSILVVLVSEMLQKSASRLGPTTLKLQSPFLKISPSTHKS